MLGLQWTEQKLWWEESWRCFCSQAHTGTAIRLLSNCNKKCNYCLRAGNGSLDPKHKQERTKHTVFMKRLIIPGFSTSYKGRTCTVWKWGEQNPTFFIRIELVEEGKCLQSEKSLFQERIKHLAQLPRALQWGKPEHRTIMLIPPRDSWWDALCMLAAGSIMCFI